MDLKASLQQLGRAVHDDPQDNDAWLNMGVALQEHVVKVDGQDIDRVYCFTKCLENDDYYWRAWYNLGIVLPPTSKVQVRSATYDRQGCLVQCLELNDTKETASAWLVLGSTLTGRTGSAVKVRDDVVDEKQCYVLALEQDPELSEGWHNLGLVSREREAVVDGQPYSMRQCFAKAIECNPNYGRAWYSLGLAIWEDRDDNTSSVSEQVQRRSYSAKDCVLQALQFEPKMACAWYLLANIIGDKSIDIGGTSYNSKRALLQAISCDDKFPLAWCNLAPILQREEEMGSSTIVVNGKEYNARNCSLKSIELQQENAYAWYNLGVSLHNGGTEVVRGQDYDAKQCYATALAYDQRIGEAWCNLGTLLGRDEKIQIVSTSYNRYACIARGEALGVQWDSNAKPVASSNVSAEAEL